MQFQYIQFTFSLQIPTSNTLTSIHAMVQKYHNTIHCKWPKNTQYLTIMFHFYVRICFSWWS